MGWFDNGKEGSEITRGNCTISPDAPTGLFWRPSGEVGALRRETPRRGKARGPAPAGGRRAQLPEVRLDRVDLRPDRLFAAQFVVTRDADVEDGVRDRLRWVVRLDYTPGGERLHRRAPGSKRIPRYGGIRSVLGVAVLNPRCLTRDDTDAPLREGGAPKGRGENATLGSRASSARFLALADALGGALRDLGHRQMEELVDGAVLKAQHLYPLCVARNAVRRSL